MDTTPGESESETQLTIKKVCRDKNSSINGAPIGRWVNENMRKERAMLAQTDPKEKGTLSNCNGLPYGEQDKSYSSDGPSAAKLKNQPQLSKEKLAKEQAERVSIIQMMKLGAASPTARRPNH